MKLAEKILLALDEGLSLSKRLNLIKKEVNNKNVLTGDLLHHLNALEWMADNKPINLNQVKHLIKQVESKLRRR